MKEKIKKKIINTVKYSEGSVIFLGCFSYIGIGKFVVIIEIIINYNIIITI